LRTSLGFKFLVILTFCLSLACNEKVLASNGQLFAHLMLSDTIDLPEFDTDTLLIPASETIIHPDSIPEINGNGEDTTLVETPRQRGAGAILDEKVEYSAKDSIRFDIRRQIVHLYGDADLTYGAIHLTAAYVNIDFKNKELYAIGMPDSLGEIVGNPVFEEGIQSFESKELRYNFETQRGRTSQVITEEADGFLHGDVVKIMETKVVHVLKRKIYYL
jgi:lipopolysaccharide assembly outer membrane protein LptD (OstA)